MPQIFDENYKVLAITTSGTTNLATAVCLPHGCRIVNTRPRSNAAKWSWDGTDGVAIGCHSVDRQLPSSLTVRQQVEKAGEPLGVEVPVWRELEQDRSEPAAEEFGPGQEAGQGFAAVIELLAVCDVAAGLEREAKVRRHAVEPDADAFLRRKTVEAAVHLH